jgi:hypothetical protein
MITILNSQQNIVGILVNFHDFNYILYTCPIIAAEYADG